MRNGRGMKSIGPVGKPGSDAADDPSVFGRKPQSSKNKPSAPQSGKRKRLRAKQIKAWSGPRKNDHREASSQAAGLGLSPDSQDNDDNRGYGRVNVTNLHCRLGEVVDLSARGLGIIGTGKPDLTVGDVSVMSLECHINDESVSAWVMCVNRTVLGRRKVRYGLRLIDKTKETRDKLTRLMSLTRKDGMQFFLDAA